ncbi:MAG: hypothetical protein ACYS9X_09460, partial [Planctomycetota bacterium]
GDELRYLFHLEAELWGPAYQRYLQFFDQPGPVPYTTVQTFLFVHAFYIIERWLHLFLPPDADLEGWGRPGKRGLLFGKVSHSGVFTCSHRQCFAALGSPFCLLGSPTGIESIDDDLSDWQRTCRADVPAPLRSFYRAACPGSDHFTTIIETSFVRTREKLPRKLFPRNPRKRRRRDVSRAMRANWYDILWRYSESVRYHPVFAGPAFTGNPFYWNRSVRWCTSLLVSGLLSMALRSDKDDLIRDCWVECRSQSPILDAVFGDGRSLQHT